MMTTNKIIIIIMIAFSQVSFAIAADTSMMFSGNISESTSPNGKYTLHNVNNEGETSHSLFLKDLKTKIDEELYKYERHIEVLWSPDGNKLLINDYGGTDYSNCIIFLLDKKKKSINIMTQLKEKMENNKKIFGNDHLFIKGTKWVNDNKVQVEVVSYGDADREGFTLNYDYSIAEGIFKFIKK